MPDPASQHAADLARSALAASLACDPARIGCLGVTRQPLPKTPPPPGMMSNDQLIYQYFVDLQLGSTRYRYRVALGQAEFLGQEG